ncbi:MAG: hypothetical protein GX979_11990 [Firmicutes bacterium]|nr:hypothetical protein [Bacillota bacterium]
MEATDGRLREPNEAFDLLQKLLALVITGYPVLLPLFEQFQTDFKGGLQRVAEALPQITEALRGIEGESVTPGELTKQLTEILPELGQFFQATDT